MEIKTVDDIIANIRAMGEVYKGTCGPHGMVSRSAVGTSYRLLASQLEEALKRERAMWHNRVKDVIEVADQFKATLDHVLDGIMFMQQSGKEVAR